MTTVTTWFDWLCAFFALACLGLAVFMEAKLRKAARRFRHERALKMAYQEGAEEWRSDFQDAKIFWNFPKPPSKPFASWIGFVRWPNGGIIANRSTGATKIQIKKSYLFHPCDEKAA